MVFPVEYEGSRIKVLKGFIVAPFIRICGLPLSKYLSFTSLGNASWLNIAVGVSANPIIPVLGWLDVYF